ncbi:hypothetical protein GGR55DRAFT_139865 [Xylaria sp. FL0064]|nr:hypothetical protein GGR55DRAFT_139865 [Xylaria sp. FL0064]
MLNMRQAATKWINKIYKADILQSKSKRSSEELAAGQQSNQYPTPPTTPPIETQAPTTALSVDETVPGNSIVNLESANISRAPSAYRARALRLRQLIQLIEQLQDGRYDHRSDEALIKKELRPYEYRQLLRIVQNPEESSLRNYFEAKLRYDYLPSKSLFVIHMITPVHEHVTRGLDSWIITWIRGLKKSRKSSKALVEVAESIVFQGAANVPLSGLTKRQPDNSYRHKDCKFPGLVIEIAWCEPPSDLRQRAEDFITRSRGGVRTFVGINLNEVYEARKKGDSGNAILSMWKAKFDPTGKFSGIERAEDKQIFQNRAGQVVASTKLELSFQDFLCKKVSYRLGPKTPKLKITAAQLCEILKEGLQGLTTPEDEESEREDGGSDEIPDSRPVPESPPRRIIRRFREGVRRSNRIQGNAAGPGLP